MCRQPDRNRCGFSLVPLLFIFVLLQPQDLQADWSQQQRDIMGTRVSVELWHSDSEQAARCSESIFSEFRRIDQLMSPYISQSELSFINNNAAISPVSISEEMAHLIERSIYFSEISNGAFDITYASIGRNYDYRKRIQPDGADIARALPAINYRHILLKNRSLSFRKANVSIDLGGIAKGYAVDRGIQVARQCGIDQVMISAGGDSRIIGNKGGRPWMIGIQHPRSSSEVALVLPLSDSAISTSGDYQRFFIENGERIHHIIDPNTGRSTRSTWSATVTGPDAMTTDALSTTIFVLGVQKGMVLIESLAGFDAIVIDSNGKLHYSSGLEPPSSEG
ncbi:MAG: thiamine biosynthesis lipoprotein [Planctomycetota bacterium]|jgi:thiamine biosynthesis lipoprotein